MIRFLIFRCLSGKGPHVYTAVGDFHMLRSAGVQDVEMELEMESGETTPVSNGSACREGVVGQAGCAGQLGCAGLRAVVVTGFWVIVRRGCECVGCCW